MSKWRTASAIEALKKTVEYRHISRINPKDGSPELFGTIALVPYVKAHGDAIFAVGLSTRRTERMPSKKIGREAALGRAIRTMAEELKLTTPTSALDQSGSYAIIRGFMNSAQLELFTNLCEQAPEHAIVHFNTALQAPSLLEAA